MSAGTRIELALTTYRAWRQRHCSEPHRSFFHDGGNERLFAGLPSNSAGVVLDVGGYQGSWTSEIIVRYGVRSIVFEPVPSFAEGIRSRFRYNDRVVVVEAGLAASQRRVPIFLDRDGSSVLRGEGLPCVDVQLLDVVTFFNELSDPIVDCMKINIEGGEYELLEAMISANLLERVRTLLIQFHNLGPGSQRDRLVEQRGLSLTHRCVFDYPFLWERWDRRDDGQGPSFTERSDP